MTRRHAIAPSTTRTNHAADRPVGLPRRQRAVSAIASLLVSCLLLSAVALGMTDSLDAPVLTAGTPATHVA